MRQTSFAGMHCSLARGLEIVGDWWSPLIVRDLWLGLRRFNDLVDDLGISRNLLTDRLAHMAEHGLITRLPYQHHPVRYEYGLTKAGQDLVPILLALTAWGDQWATPPGGAPLRLRHDTCGHQFTPRIVCEQCGHPLHADEVTALSGPGGRQAPGTRLIAAMLATRERPADHRPREGPSTCANGPAGAEARDAAATGAAPRQTLE